jgi:uncharacterized protein (DUF2336 family)
VAGSYDRTLSASERQIALGIIEILVQDIEQEVRAAISTNLAACPTVPHDIAKTLASDEDGIAVPMLRVSQVLTNDDLVAIVRSGSSEKRQAIAGRPTVSSGVADALIETEDQAAVGVLLANEGAAVSEASLHKALDSVALSDTAQQVMAERPKLPPSIVQKLVKTVSGSLRSTLVARYALDPDLIEKIAETGEEQVTKSISKRVDPAAAKVTISLLRTLFAADLTQFEIDIAARADVPLNDARRHLKLGAAGLEVLYRKAALPTTLFTAFRIALDEVKALGKSHDPGLAKRVTRRIVQEYQTIKPGSAEDVLSQLSRAA